MAISLYELSVPNYLQVLGSVAGVLQKGADHAQAQGVDVDDYVQLRLADDMHPLSFQILSVWHHSLGAIRGLQAGQFSPPPDLGEKTYADLQGLVAEASSELQALPPDDIDVLEDNAMMFKMGEVEIPFTPANFVQSFSLPNFYFHATTAYDLLRMQGVPLGKMDYLGAMRMG